MTEELVPQQENEPKEIQEPVKKVNTPALVSMIGGILTFLWLPITSLLNTSGWLAVVLSPISALVAVIAGARAKRNIRQSQGELPGRKMANAGLWLGWIFIIGTILLIILGFTVLGGLIGWVGGLLK